MYLNLNVLSCGPQAKCIVFICMDEKYLKLSFIKLMKNTQNHFHKIFKKHAQSQNIEQHQPLLLMMHHIWIEPPCVYCKKP